MRLSRDHHVSLDGSSKIFAKDAAQAGFHMTAQGVADVHLLAGNCPLHGMGQPVRARAGAGTNAQIAKLGSCRHRSSVIRLTSRAAFAAGGAPKRESASPRGT